MKTLSLSGTPVLVYDPDGAPIATPADALDAIVTARLAGAEWLVIPAARLAPEFFELRSGLAGEIAQKAVNYGMRLAILGNVEEALSRSQALRDFVREANRGAQLWLMPDFPSFEQRVSAAARRP